MPETLFRAVAKPLMSDQVTDEIERAIVTGILKPGQKLSLDELASEFQMSQIPVREAFNRLAAIGLIIRKPNQGTFVVKFSPDEVEAILEVRDRLEGLAVRLAALRATPEDITVLRTQIAQMERAARAQDTVQLAQIDIEFHRTLWACTRNPFLEKSLATLVVPMFGFNMAAHLLQIDLSSYTLKHERIVDAIAQSDGDLAEQQIIVLSNDTRKVVAQERDKLPADSATNTSRKRQRGGRGEE